MGNWIIQVFLVFFDALTHTTGNNVGEDRIVGGTKVKPHTLPWQVAMIPKGDTDGQFFVNCGGVIICPRFVLTAAHCTEGKKPNALQVLAGAHNIDKIEPSTSRHDIAKFHDHPSYNNPGEYSTYDYSILQLSQPILFKDEARPVFLHEST